MEKRQKRSLAEPTVYPETSYPLAPSLQQKEEKGIRCLACVRQCLLPRETVGYCTAIVNWHDQLHSTAYGVIGEATVTPIENRPVYHYRPGTRTLCLGALGCNLRCAFCQNWEVAFRDARTGGHLAQPNLLPEQAIELALEQHCDGIAWTFNEPSITPMYVYTCARLAHDAGLYTVFVTNGYMTRQALALLGPYLDVYRIDVKSLDEDFYRQVASASRIDSLLPIAREAREAYGIHVETVTNLMPTLNDSDEHLKRLTHEIVQQLGENTPWHVTSYVPYAHMTHIPPTPPETLVRARSIALQTGLRFVYTDNPAAPTTAHTYCPGCGALLIERLGHRVTRHHLNDEGQCTGCGHDIPILLTPSSTVVSPERDFS
ncbi:MAG TPA: AmmeMemoRadiSam system radical SAM enzyme [Ktedonobacteraceae bacterium]|nr:AmmeMemoRadiSam system radical SAM enzyme [Ktedonobacteraceae bacterium]